MSRFFSTRFSSLKPYVPGEQPRDTVYIKLNTNESPFPPEEAVIQAVREEADKLRLYPDPTGLKLREALADCYGFSADNYLLGNGSDEVLFLAILAFCDAEHPMVCPELSYGFYPVLADLCGIERKTVPLKDDFSLDPEGFLKEKGMIVLANPNAPTGIELPTDQIERMLRSDPDWLVLVDEAYVAFGAKSCLPLLTRYDNLLIVRTFSKSHSLAGARLGFAAGSPDVIRDMETVRNSFHPYNINRMTMAAGITALKNEEIFRQNAGIIIKNREMTREALQKMGCLVLPSKANFLFASPPDGRGEDWYRNLKAKGILVRWFADKKTAPFIRISIGTQEQMKAFLKASKEYIEEADHEKS